MGAAAVLLMCLLAAAACTALQSARQAAPQVPPARVTISTGNLTFTSPGAAAGTPPGAAAGTSPGAAARSRVPGGRGAAARHRGGTSGRTLTSGAVNGSQGAVSGPQGAAAPGGQAAAARLRRPALIDRHPDQGIAVHVSGGTLARVEVTTGAGVPVAGGVIAGSTAWHTRWALAPAQRYRVTVVAVTRLGGKTVTTGTFRTLRPLRTFRAWTTLSSGQVYGVGMPIMIDFSRPIAGSAQPGVERSLQLWSSRPVTGAWYWMSNTELWFRPRHYWPAHIRVRLAAHLRGVRAAPGVYGDANLRLHFRIGSSLVVVASAASHHMKVWWNGRLRGRWPVSTGQPGLDTPDGHYLSFAMGNPVDMNSATFGVMPGDPGYYNVMVYDSVQFTGSGDYIHSAPWSVGEQGYVNVSHGCVNVAPGNAAWYYGHSLIGDPITVVGSPVRGTWGDGWTIWFLSWRKLLAGSSTGQAVLAAPGGSRFVTPSLAPSRAAGHFRSSITP